MDLEIGNRLLELRKNNNYSQAFIAEKLSISQAAYSLIENSLNCINTDHVRKLSDLYSVTTDFILKGVRKSIPISPSTGFVPFIKKAAYGGLIKNPSEKLVHEEVEWFKIPGFNPTEDHYLLQIEGNSMVPTVFSGDILICQKTDNWDKILNGSIVMVLTYDTLQVKRIKRIISGGFNFECDNPAESEVMNLSEDKIQEIFMVRGKISNVLVPNHHITSIVNVQNLEKRIEFLEKEIYSITKSKFRTN